jgi:hypothetical protein
MHMKATKAFRVIADPKAQKAETYRYWQSLSIAERFDAIIQATANAYAIAGKSFDVTHRSERTLTRIQR